MASRSSNRAAVPEAKGALDKFKYEVLLILAFFILQNLHQMSMKHFKLKHDTFGIPCIKADFGRKLRS